VVRQFFEPHSLAAEIDQVMRDGLVADVSRTGGVRFQYVPMMSAKTPVSLSLLDRVQAMAAAMLGGSVIPTRAKAVRIYTVILRGTRILLLHSPALAFWPTSSL
jgi:hypothetical protein